MSDLRPQTPYLLFTCRVTVSPATYDQRLHSNIFKKTFDGFDEISGVLCFFSRCVNLPGMFPEITWTLSIPIPTRHGSEFVKNLGIVHLGIKTAVSSKDKLFLTSRYLFSFLQSTIRPFLTDLGSRGWQAQKGLGFSAQQCSQKELPQTIPTWTGWILEVFF